MTASARRHYSGQHKDAEQDDKGDPGRLGKGMLRNKCECWTSVTTGGRWRQQVKTELDEAKWSVAYAALAATRHKSILSKTLHSFFQFLPERDVRVLAIANLSVYHL